jgi:uncharacterized protein
MHATLVAMRDPDEGLDASGLIVTGARRDRVAEVFMPTLQAAIEQVRTLGDECSLFIYGSVATGVAVLGVSDLDLLTIGLPTSAAEALSTTLSVEFADVCRAVEIATAQSPDYERDDDESHGNRIFLRHYCVHLAGPDVGAQLPRFAGDVRAARGFNGDVARHTQRWRESWERGDDPILLGRRMARKLLLAVAGLVSVHDGVWTTDRATAAERWAQVDPSAAPGLRTMQAWADGIGDPTTTEIGHALDGIVATVVQSFERSIGLWR